MKNTCKLCFIASLTLFIAGMAGAQGGPWENGLGTPDGLPPAYEDVCDATSGAAYGLCVAFCEAMDCDSDDPQASEQACTRVGDRFVQITGEMPPCLQVCPCWEPADLNAVTAANQLPYASCEETSGGGVIIQTAEPVAGAEGGFATIDFGGGGQCLTRDQPPWGVELAADQWNLCSAQIIERCEQIGTPVGGDGGGGEPPPP